MSQFLSTYGIFLAKTITTVIAILIILGFIAVLTSKDKSKTKLKIKKINDKYKQYKNILNKKILTKKELKKLPKEKKNSSATKKRIFVLDFKGDIKATAVENLREEITAILNVATPQDEIVVNIESGGGTIHGYGLAASQLERIRAYNIPLTATIDKVAASGGYLMASVANQILAAPFAIIGSIGVIAQLPNFHRLLKKHDIEFEQISSGEFKRTLSLFGENTAKGRKKMQEDVEEAHQLFKDFVATHRPTIDMNKIATGEIWHGKQALELGLVDKIITSDDYLLTSNTTANIYQVSYIIKKKISEKLQHNISTWVENKLHRFI